ncbi:UDP-N-acetylglucosamine 1-carboxyvinyltransferase [invertebrate metagenome]|uniref:UDP-N-acetylglucosamine 1-carboxyvinyltransferase n=1 Tax=invertebrate metagenome TaxID=1711999 RepID=A0A484H727_9ZZZZ
MDRIRIFGGVPLKGTISIIGSKNAALPLMAASLLTDDILTLCNMPYLVDIITMAHLLVQHGVGLSINDSSPNSSCEGRTLALCGRTVTNTTAPYELVRRMRASVLVLGPLVARFGQARVSLPGGCAIGTRPVDLHIKGLEQMGACIKLNGGYIEASVQGRLKGTQIIFPQISVGATENLLMAAVLARGETVLMNAAREPEVCDLAHCLTVMGARIEGIGTDTLLVEGVDYLHGATYRIVSDRIEAGTYAVAAAITRGEIELINARQDLMVAIFTYLKKCGVQIHSTKRGINISAVDIDLTGVDVMTEPYPGFPTDMQAQVMALMTTARGAAMITETIFENRLMHVPELIRMGAQINIHRASSAIVRGVPRLSGAPVMATDLRASVCLVLAGLSAQGETMVNRIYHLDRGYERLVENMATCGACLERVRD